MNNGNPYPDSASYGAPAPMKTDYVDHMQQTHQYQQPIQYQQQQTNHQYQQQQMPAQHHQQMNMAPVSNVGGASAAEVAGFNANFPLPDDCPVQDIKLFVGKIPNEFAESDVLPLFEAWGTVIECVIIRDKSNSKSKGSAFVRMKRLCDADAAIKELHNKKNLGSESLGPMQVKYAVGEAERIGLSESTANPGIDEAKLFVGSLPRTADEDSVREQFSGYGEIREIFLIRDPPTGQCKGCAFVKFAYKESGLWACRELNGNVTFPGFNRPLEVRFAESKRMQTTPQSMAQYSNTTPATMGSAMPMTASINANAQHAVAVAPPSNDNPRQAGSWKEYFDDTKKPYYHNEKTGETTWNVPAEFHQLDQAAALCPVAPAVGGHMHPSSSLPRAAAPLGAQGSDVAGPPGANVFVFHVPNEWTQQDLLRAFNPWGTIVSARVAIDKVTLRNKGYAFVSYDNINSAAQAVANMNGYMAGTKRLKVSIKQGEEQYVAHLNTTPTNQANAPRPVNGMGGPSSGTYPNGQARTNRVNPY